MMDPIKTNPPVTPISSRTVIWQGPDIPCIGLCKNDSIDKVIFKLAELLCELAGNQVDITSLDFKCLVEIYATEPEKLVDIIQLIIDKMCSIEEALEGVGVAVGDPVTIALPISLQYTDPNGEHIVRLEHTQYSYFLAQKIVDLLTLTNTLQVNIANHDSRLDAIEAALDNLGGSETETVKLIHYGEDTTLSLPNALLLIEDVIFDINTVLGENTELTTSVNKQCAELATAKRLGGNGIMSSINGWVSSPSTIADTITNIWLTLCDLRSGIITLSNIASPKCSDITLDFNASLSASRELLTVSTYGKCLVPIGVTTDTEVVPFLEISDSDSTATVPVDLLSLNVPGATSMAINLTTLAGIDPLKSLTVSLKATFILPDGGKCEKISPVKSFNGICIKPTASNIVANMNDTYAKVSWDAPESSSVIGYRAMLYTGPELDSYVSSGSTEEELTIVFAGLTAATNYKVVVYAKYACGNSIGISKTFTTGAAGIAGDKYTITLNYTVGEVPIYEATFEYVNTKGFTETVSLRSATLEDSTKAVCTLPGTGEPVMNSGNATKYSISANGTCNS